MTSEEPNFDRVADVYRWAEYLTLGPALQRARTHFLTHLDLRKDALILGDGDGRFASALLMRNKSVRITAVDTSERMLTLLRKRCAHSASRLSTAHESAQTFALPPAADLIVTHFFLDCLSQQQANQLAQRIADNCPPNTLWLVSDFAIPESRALRVLGAVYVRFLYAVFGTLTGLRVRSLPDTAFALQVANFRRIARQQWLGGLLYTELWERT